jgi:hypothetical protein
MTCDPTNANNPCSVGEPVGTRHGVFDGGGLHSEGSDSAVSFGLPLWSLASEWGWGVSFSHRFAPVREYLGTGIFAYVDPNTGNLLPREYNLKRWSANANVVRQWGTTVKYQVRFGYSLTSTRPELLNPPPTMDPTETADFIRDVFPRSEVLSAPYVGFFFFTPRYRVSRNINTYELAEDFQLGPTFDVSVSQGLTAFGSSSTYTSPSLSLGWTLPWCRDGYVSAGAAVGLRFQNTTLNNGTPVGAIDNTASASLSAITPIYRVLRVVAQASIATRWNDTQNAFLSIGQTSGLRGFDINEFIGQRRISGIVEARSLSIRGPWFLDVLRFGAVAFYEIGGAANTVASMPIHQDIGIGVRMLVPQTSRDLWRFDFAFPLDSTPGAAAFSPHFIFGFGSYF